MRFSTYTSTGSDRIFPNARIERASFGILIRKTKLNRVIILVCCYLDGVNPVSIFGFKKRENPNKNQTIWHTSRARESYRKTLFPASKYSPETASC